MIMLEHRLRRRGGRAGADRASGAPWNRKTRLCTKFVNTGSCPYGDRCNFAHGQHELKRPHPNGHAQWEADPMAQQMGMGGMLGMGMLQVRPFAAAFSGGRAPAIGSRVRGRLLSCELAVWLVGPAAGAVSF